MNLRHNIVRISVIVLGIVLTMSSVTAQRYKSISLSRHNFVDTVKVNIMDGAVFIPVEINGVIRYLMFDTGAQTGFWIGTEEDWMQPSGDFTNVIDSQNARKKLQVFTFPPMKVGSTIIENYSMFVHDGMSGFVCGMFDGVLGFDLVTKGLSFKFDTKDSLMIVTDRKGFFTKEERGKPYLKYISVLNSSPMVWVQFPFSRIKMLFDTGYIGGWMDLPQQSLNRWAVADPKMKRAIDELTLQVDTTIAMQAGLFGRLKDTIIDRRLLVPEVNAGGITLKDMYINTGKQSLKMGSALLEHMSLIIDASKKRFVFLPHDNTLELVVNNEGNGLSFIPAEEGDTLGAAKAVVRKGSKAYREGIRTGDYLISVNGIRITDYCTYALIGYREKITHRVVRNAEGEEKEIDW